MKLSNIISTTTLSLTTSAVDYAALFPDGPSAGDGVALLFFGDNTATCYFGNADKSRRLPVAGEVLEYSTINRDTWVAQGLTYMWADSATDITVSVLAVRG